MTTSSSPRTLNLRWAWRSDDAAKTVPRVWKWSAPAPWSRPVWMAGLVSYGQGDFLVRRRVKVATVITGDELLAPGAPTEDWEIRDSNGPALRTLLAPVPWIDYRGQTHAKDDYESLLSVIREGLAGNDALFVTGGVSMGTHDFVPAALRAAGCRVIFHKLPQRPGFPLLGAIGPEGQLVLGLPGNPLAVMCSARRIGD